MGRDSSSIISIRRFHNWVKNEQIKEVVKLLKKDRIYLLDLAVGRGGDIHKWVKNGINDVIGFDIDAESVDEAKRRLKKLNRRINYRFYVADLSDPSTIPLVNQLVNRKADIISCQFAIHYFFKNDETLDTFFKIVSDNIAINGFFIGTTVDGDKVKTFQNGVFKIDVLDGNKYEISLGEKGEDHYFRERSSVEYRVQIDRLKTVGEKHGLLFIGTVGFNEWFKTAGTFELTDEEKEFSFLNFSFVFYKPN